MQICENTVTLGLHSGDYPMLQPLSTYTDPQSLQIGRNTDSASSPRRPAHHDAM